MRIFKLVLESWPTPDGRPFADQDEALWEQAVAHWSGGNSDAIWPSWLPAGLDFTDRVPTDESFGGIQSTPGYWVGGPHLILIVPAAPKRVHYFSKSAASWYSTGLPAFKMTSLTLASCAAALAAARRRCAIGSGVAAGINRPDHCAYSAL